MKIELLNLLRCPQTDQSFTVKHAQYSGGKIQAGQLVTIDGRYSYPIRNFIPRFVPESNYADNFGMQWKKFRMTQLDSYSGHDISKKRFFDATKWKPDQLKGQWILDVGCGAGRFAEIALDAGAKVVAIDYSSAVDATFANLKQHEDLNVIQADIYALPLQKGLFSFVYSLGVLQHTPDVKRAFFSLPPMLKKGGHFCVDFYQKTWRSSLLPKYWLRPFTKRMNKNKLFAVLEKVVPFLLPVSVGLSRIPVMGRLAKRIIPVANFYGELPLSKKQHIEWSLLDTFDWLSPEFDNPQTKETVALWMKEANMGKIEVLQAGHLVGRGVMS
jgi:2-polyprenyl-3-methyl-5-hydroxy-6-metoxy-1,4-benzoquinol methylase